MEKVKTLEHMNSPDRPIHPGLFVLRTVVRKFRLAVIKLKLREKFIHGRNVSIGKQHVLIPQHYFRLGNNIGIGRGFHLESDLDVGDDTLISSNVMIVGDDHKFDQPDVSVFFGGRRSAARVVIEGDTLIGARTVIVGNVRIGKGAIVGAGSVVVKDLPVGMVCCGVPAKPIRPRWRSTSKASP